MAQTDLYRLLSEGFSGDIAPVNPVEWADERAGIYLWSKQREIANSVMNHKRTAVRSAHTTGKSYLAATLAAWWIDTHPVGQAFVISTAPSTKQVHGVLWEYIRAIHRTAKLDGVVQISDNWLIGNELVGFGRKPQDYDQHSFQGFHRPYVLFILDEAGGINKWLWTAAEVATNTPNCRILAIGNPDDSASEFANVCRPGSGWNSIKISAYDTPNFTSEEVPLDLAENLVSVESVDEWLFQWGEDHPYWMSKVLAEFPNLDEFSTIPMGWVLAANARWEEWVSDGMPVPNGRKILGVDIARFGPDKSVIAHRKGDVIMHLEEFSKKDNEAMATIIAQRLKDRTEKAIIDVTGGYGTGPYDRLRKQGYSVEGFNAGVRTSLTDSSGKIGFASLRSAAWWSLREALDPGRGATLCLPTDEALTGELIAPRWRDVLNGKILVEQKRDIRTRLGRSTDRADAVIMAMWVSGRAVALEPTEAFDWIDRYVEGGAVSWEHDSEWEELNRDNEWIY